MAHLTPDELDLLLEQALPPAQVAHLDTCSACAQEARETLALARAMATLPSLAPAPGFADRVLAALGRPAPAAVPSPVRHPRWMPARRRVWALAAGFAGLSLVSTSVAAAWLLANQAVVTAATSSLLSGATALLLSAWGAVMAQLGSLPWADAATLLATEPLRLAAFASIAVLTYATLLTALWKLMRPPRRGYAPSA